VGPGAPVKPYRPLQLRYKDPWKQAVVCILLNRTHRRQVKPVLPALFRMCPSPLAMARSGPELEELLRPLGLWRQRAHALREFSKDWRRKKPLEECRGIGPYALESRRIFQCGDLGFEPQDKELRAYVLSQTGGS